MAFLAPLLTQAREYAIGALGAKRFEAELEAGRRLNRESALSLALDQPVPVSAAVAEAVDIGPLGRREAEVARLVADGLSNKQIGVRLFISERTVDSHVQNILNKIGFNSRAQIAGWVRSSDQ
jgi:DNA-binding NarL/FixJ family response regulator